jgi:cysteine desulfuration protein SufE
MAELNTDEIIDDLCFFDDWEEKYKYIIDLGRDLPELEPEFFTEDRLVKGCQSNVWLQADFNEQRFQFRVASDAVIVKGLLALVMAAYNNKTPADVIAFDIDNYFNQLDLERHLSPTRGNGLRAIVAKIQALAQSKV